jgi:hypothetical protein
MMNNICFLGSVKAMIVIDKQELFLKDCRKIFWAMSSNVCAQQHI